MYNSSPLNYSEGNPLRESNYKIVDFIIIVHSRSVRGEVYDYRL